MAVTIIRRPDFPAKDAVVQAFAQGIPDPDNQDCLVFFGHKKGYSYEAIWEARRTGRDHYWIDHPYMHREKWKNAETPLPDSAWFRVTKNGHQANRMTSFCHLRPALAASRFAEPSPAPWIERPQHAVIFCRAAEDWIEIQGDCVREWEEAQLQSAADAGYRIIYRRREDVARLKPLPQALWKHQPALLITHSSVAAVEALLAGVSVMVSEESVCAPWATHNVNNLWRGDRSGFIPHLYSNQFTIAEMRDGTAWKALNEQPSLRMGGAV